MEKILNLIWIEYLTFYQIYIEILGNNVNC